MSHSNPMKFQGMYDSLLESREVSNDSALCFGSVSTPADRPYPRAT